MKAKFQRYLWDGGTVLLGSFLMAVGLNLFLVPSMLSTGGAGSLATVFLYLFRIPFSVTVLGVNLILLALGFRILGFKAVLRTLFGVAVLSAWLQATSFLSGFSEDLLLSALSGGALVGAGLGLLIRRGCSTGGSELAATLLHRLIPHISVTNFLLLVDCSVILISGLVFRSITVTFYSYLALLVCVKAADLVINVGTKAKYISIISSRGEAIAAMILERFQRGVTGLYGRGMYTGTDRMILSCAVTPKQLPALVRAVRNTDSAAFLIITDAHAVYGEGFSEPEP